MIEINRNVKVGDTVFIDSLSWQVEVDYIGEYKITCIEDDMCYLTKAGKDRAELIMRPECVGYLTGKHIECEYNTVYSSDYYLPEDSDGICVTYDEYSEDYEIAELGFWFFGWCGDYRILDSMLLDRRDFIIYRKPERRRTELT